MRATSIMSGLCSITGTNGCARCIVSLFICLFLSFSHDNKADAAELQRLDTVDAAIFHEKALAGPAEDLAAMYPAVRKELEQSLELPVDFRPSIILVSNEEAFEQITGSRLIVAYAIPEKMLMVMDYARSSKDPFSLRAILKHELCHLLLHRHIKSLPRWLDEGVSQWVSGGFAELFSPKSETSLRWATISGELMSLDALDKRFPADEPGLILAYEQSRSIVDYIVSVYGRNGVINILTALEKGATTSDAVEISLGKSLAELEKSWRQSLRTFSTLLALAISNIYTIIFFLAGLATVAGYVRYQIRKRRFSETEEDFPENPPGPL